MQKKINRYYFIQIVLFIIYFVIFNPNTLDMESKNQINAISEEAYLYKIGYNLARILIRFTCTEMSKFYLIEIFSNMQTN